MVDQIENTISSSAKSVIDVTTDITNDCTFRTQNNQVFIVKGGTSFGCTVDSKFSSATTLDTTCIASIDRKSTRLNSSH